MLYSPAPIVASKTRFHMRVGVFSLITLLTFATSSAAAAPLTLKAGDSLLVDFVVTQTVTWDIYGPPDALELSLWEHHRDVHTTTAGSLFDGATLLGVTLNNGVIGFYDQLSTEAAMCCSGFGTLVDFTSILDGSIEGRVEFLVTGGALTFADEFVLARLSLYNIDSPGGGGIGHVSWVTVTSIAVNRGASVPEPALFSLLALGLGLAARRRLRREYRQ
jgi:hypothetical protein